jgi:protein-disulfide isomerase
MEAGHDLRSAPCPGLRDDDHVRGPADAPLVIFYADFTCPRCDLARVRLGEAQVRVAFRHLALSSRHVRALPTAHAAEAAAAQDAFWAFHDAVYAQQGRMEDPHLWEHARALGLDVDRFDADRRSPEVVARVQRDVRDGLAAGATATPTLFIDGEAHMGVPDPDLLSGLGYDRTVRIPKDT